jgi:hypothetical protein
MARKIDDIFNECYERMRSGESLESCLRSYPQYRHELEPLLRTTLDVGRKASYIQPRPEFKHWARVRIESAQRYPRQQATVEKSGFPGWLRHGWAIAVVAGIIIVLGTGSTMAASSNALPDEPLFPMKLFTENVQRAVAVSPERKAQLETDIANIRAAELEAMANAGNTEQAIKAAERYDSQFEKAVQAIVKAGGTETAVPPAVTTPPAATPPTTTPVTTPPPPVVTQPSVTAVSENATQTTTPPPTATPSTTNQKPPSTTNQQPSTTTTNNNSQASKIENLKKSLDRSTSKSLAALRDAQEKASENSKSEWQSAYDKIKDRQNRWSKDNETSTSDNTTIQKDSNTRQDASSNSRNNSSSSNRRSNHR